MKKNLLVALAALPLVAFAQGAGPGPGAGPRGKNGPPNPEFAQKRMRVARSIGLAEVLDLDSAQALKLDEQLAKVDQRRFALRQQIRDSHQLLRRAAQGEKVAPADVDGAIQKALEARAQLQAVDRETLSIVTQGLTPEKKARAVLFLARFHDRFPGGPGMHGGRGMGPCGEGMGPGGGWGPGRGMGRGMQGMGPGGPGFGPMGMNDAPTPGDPWGLDDDE